MKSKILELVKKQESEILEFKPSLSQIKDIIETISAFSNTKGGSIIIGVDDKRNIIGVDVGKKTIESLANKIKQNTDPQIYPSISVEYINGKNVVIIEVKESKSKPVFAIDRVYKRVGKSNHRVSSDEIRKLAVEGKKIYWDEQVCEGANLEDIDEGKVKRFLEKARFERRLDITPNISVREALERLNLIKSDRLTNAAILLFGKNPQKFFLQAETRCARFKGTKPLEFIDMKVFGGNIIDQMEDSLEFVKEHIKLHAKIVGIERIETWEYPIEAIREGITNAICHRDYEIPSNVQVRIFDDRIEIWNPGLLPKGLTIEKLKGKHESILRNLLVGRCFFLIKYIEQWGTGTNRIIKWCLKHGLPEPIFEETGTSFLITFRKEITEDFLRERGLNERQIRTVAYVRKEGQITNREYQKLFDVSKRTASSDLASLTKIGVLKKLGKGKRDLKYCLH